MTKLVKLFLISILCISPFLLSSCDYKDVDEYAIVVGISLDKVGNTYKLGLQIVNPTEIAGRVITQRPEMLEYTIEAKNGENIFYKMSEQIHKSLDLSHVKVVLIGERLARENILFFNDLYDRNILFNQAATILVVSDGIEPTRLLTTLIPDAKTTADRIEQILRNSNKNFSTAYKATFEDLIIGRTMPGIHPVVQNITMRGDISNQESIKNPENEQKTNPNTQINLGGLSIFNELKLVDSIDVFYIPYFLVLRNKAHKFYAQTSCDGGKYSKFQVSDINIKMKVNIKNDIPHFTGHVTLKADLISSECELEENNKTITQTEKRLSNEIKKNLYSVVAIMQQKMSVDAFGFGQKVRSSEKNYWKKHKNEWDDIFIKSTFSFSVDTTLTSFGLMNEQPNKKIEKIYEVGPHE